MEFRLLGEFQVRAAGQSLDPGLPQQQAVLAALLVDVGRPLSAAELVDRVWGERQPAQVRKALYSHLSRIRRMLADGVATAGEAPVGIVHRAAGYVLTVDPDDVDIHRFRRLVDQARDPRCADADEVHLLQAALDLWHGTPLAGIPGSWAAGVRDGCRQMRLEAVLRWARAQLRVGCSEPVLGVVPDFTAEFPLVEPLEGVLIAALHAAGRDAEALDRYARVRQRLVEQLGVEPGAELRELHQAILRGERPVRRRPERPPAAQAAWPAVVPAQLPADVAGFAGRVEHLARLDGLLVDAPAQAPTAVVVSAVSGTAGVGKTALAVHWSHRVRDQFPDGQLYVNLRGSDPAGRMMEPAEAIRGFLDALGVPSQRIPFDIDAQTALYRTLLTGKRVLVLLDNARDAQHVRPLLPGTPTALAVVTSRNKLTPLVATAGAHPLSLDLLTPEEAGELLLRRLGAARAAAEPQAVQEIITRCAGLPLALSIASARAQQSGFPLAALAAELTDAGTRLDALDAGDAATQVRGVFSWSYNALAPAAARLFRLLGLHSGPEVSAAAAASLAGHPPPRTRLLLAELLRANLLSEHVPGRYTFHDLLRVYATDLTHAHDTSDQRRAATIRLLDHYVHTAHIAARLLDSTRAPMPLPLTPPAVGVTPERLADDQQAMAWLSAEHPALLAILQLAADTGHHTHAWQLAWTLQTFLHRRGHRQDLAAAWQTALAAAGRLGNPAAQAYAHRSIARAHTLLGCYPEAQTHLECALDLSARTGDRAGQAHAHHHLGYLCERQGRPEQALLHAQQALTLYQAAGDRRGQAQVLNAVGWCHARLGDHTQALTHSQHALTLLQQLGERRGAASTWDSLGYAHHHLGHHARATDCYLHALTLFRELGDRYNEADILTHLGDAHRAASNPHAARITWQQALGILTDLEHPDADGVRAKLRALDQQSPDSGG